MSKIKAAIITAILGTSSAAMASPTVSFNANARFSYGTSYGTPYSAPVIRDHTQAPVYAMPSTRSTSWVSLANYLNLSSGRDVLRPESNLRASALTLRANTGSAYVQKVSIRFEDGTKQVMDVNQWMTTRNAAIQLDLRGRGRIDSITIIGTPSGRATYSVLAQSQMMNRPPVFEQPAPILNVTGHYSSVHGDIYLTQRGNRVTGTYPGKEGTIEGTMIGNQLHFRWNQPAARIVDTTGHGVFTFDGGRHVEGTWGLGNADSGAEWDLKLVR